MASVLSPRRLPAQAPSRPASARAGRWRRRAARLLLALPLIALAVAAHQAGFVQHGLQFLERRGSLAEAGGPDLSGLRYAYPPLPVLLAMTLPGGPLTLAVVTSLCSAAMLAYVGERLLRRLSWPAAAVLLAPLVAVPAMWYAASELLAPVIALSFLVIALDGFIGFAVYGETAGGFAAGLALALSYCADPGALLYGAVMCAFAPLISHIRYHDDAVATASIGAVLIFPILAVAASWSYLVWKFSGTFPGSLQYAPGAHVLAFPSGLLPGLGHAAAAGLTDLLHAPLYVFAAVVLFPRRRAASFALALPVLALIAALWLGFAYTQVTAYFMFTLLALMVIMHAPVRRYRWARWMLLAAAAGQLVLGIFWPPLSPGFTGWLHALAR